MRRSPLTNDVYAATVIRMVSRGRMIFDLPKYVQMAIRLRAIKSGIRTGEVISEAVRLTFPDEVAEASKLAGSRTKPKIRKRQK